MAAPPVHIDRQLVLHFAAAFLAHESMVEIVNGVLVQFDVLSHVKHATAYVARMRFFAVPLHMVGESLFGDEHLGAFGTRPVLQGAVNGALVAQDMGFAVERMAATLERRLGWMDFGVALVGLSVNKGDVFVDKFDFRISKYIITWFETVSDTKYTRTCGANRASSPDGNLSDIYARTFVHTNRIRPDHHWRSSAMGSVDCAVSSQF